ncbi:MULTISPECIES: NADPH-dependent FMN reductase [unclassified Streptomyces]|uniref:NADPH-dependent FMN reductase n=1 Tax=unclassified Streptomyces TaxID=2593676 RepID=UPI000CD4CE9A|nr:MULTISPECIES: NAD(P)H-dependent oxidoreductase [unclassified Streptomyces]
MTTVTPGAAPAADPNAEPPAPRVAVIVAATRPGRIGLSVGRWFERLALSHGGVRPELLDLAELGLTATELGSPATPFIDDFRERLASADAFVVVTPEYNHGYPAALKQAIDLSGPQWAAKPVAFVSYGGLGGGIRSVEQLRQVFPELYATTIRDTVSFHGAWDHFGADGRADTTPEQDAAAKKLIDQLLWWARALATARESHPYGSVS